MFVVMCLGFLLELGGLGMAARGFWATWRDNADGRPFLPLWVRRLRQWFRVRILRQPRTHPVGTSRRTAWDTMAIDDHAQVALLLTEDQTLEQKVEAVQQNALRALEDASQARVAVTSEQRAREQAIRELTSRLEGAEVTLTTHAKGLVVDGIPTAVAGLVLAALGLIFQALASIATFSS
jgi:hypothetical protein